MSTSMGGQSPSSSYAEEGEGGAESFLSSSQTRAASCTLSSSPEGREARRHSLRKAGDGQTWGKAHGTPCGCRSENAVDRRENMLLRRFRECNGPVSTRSGPFPGIKYGLAWTVGRNRKMPWESLEKMSQYREIRTADGNVGSLPACVS